MKFSKYLEQLNQLAKEQPETLDMDVIYAKDDEGNGFQQINYSPTVGEFDGAIGEYDNCSKNKNAVCVN